MNLVTLYADDDADRKHITEDARDGDVVTVATKGKAAELNECIRAGGVSAARSTTR